MYRCIPAALPPFWFSDNKTSSCSGNYWKLKLTGILSKGGHSLYCINVENAVSGLASNRHVSDGQSPEWVNRQPGVKLAVILVIWTIKLHRTTNLPRWGSQCWAGGRLKLTLRCGSTTRQREPAHHRHENCQKKRTLTSSHSPFTVGETMALGG